MGLFKNNECYFCGKDSSFIKFKTADGVPICVNCLKNFSLMGTPIITMTLENVENLLKTKEENYENYKLLQISKSVKYEKCLLQLDDTNKLFAICNTGNVYDIIIYNYSDLIDYEYSEDGRSISKGGLGGAITGGVLFGGVGAIIGGGIGKKTKDIVNDISINITVNDVNQSRIKLTLLNSDMKKNGFVHKIAKESAQEFISALNYIANSIQPVLQVNSDDVYGELKNLKELLDLNIITQEEFDTKKTELLNK